MALEDSEDEIRMEVDEDGLKEELAEQINNGDADEALERMENLGIDVDDLDLWHQKNITKKFGFGC